MFIVWIIIYNNLYYGIKFIEKVSVFLFDDNMVIYLVWFIKKIENKFNFLSIFYEFKSIEIYLDKFMFFV